MPKPKLQKLPPGTFREMNDLAANRVGEAVMTVLQLVDRPKQAADIALNAAANLLRLASHFEHTERALRGEEVANHHILADMMMTLLTALKQAPPSPQAMASIARLKQMWDVE